jgi:hypothetical protein
MSEVFIKQQIANKENQIIIEDIYIADVADVVVDTEYLISLDKNTNCQLDIRGDNNQGDIVYSVVRYTNPKQYYIDNSINSNGMKESYFQYLSGTTSTIITGASSEIGIIIHSKGTATNIFVGITNDNLKF